MKLLSAILFSSISAATALAGATGTSPVDITCYDNPGLVGLALTEDLAASQSRSTKLGRSVTVFSGFAEMLEGKQKISFEADSVAWSTASIELKGNADLGGTLYSQSVVRIPQTPLEGYLVLPVRGASFTRSFDRCYIQ